MKLGCDTVLFNQLDLYGALQHIAWAGYDGAEICIHDTWARHIELNTKQSYIDEVKSVAKKHGLELLAIDADVRTQSDEDKIKSMTKVFDVALKLSIPIVTTFPYRNSVDEEAIKQDFKYIRELSKRAESRGITLAVKPHITMSFYNTTTLIQMLDEINSPALGVNLDLLQLFKVGDDLSAAILKIGKRIVHTHFHDCPNRGQSRETPEEQIPGRGDIDFPKILGSLKNIGYDKALSVHVVGGLTYPLSRQMGIAAEARGYLHRCLQELN